MKFGKEEKTRRYVFISVYMLWNDSQSKDSQRMLHQPIG